MTFSLNGRPVETGGPEDRLLPWNRVRDIAGISRTTAWRMQRTGAFPSPVAVSPGRVGWWESELTAWKGARGAPGNLLPPARPRLPGMPRRSPPKVNAGGARPAREADGGVQAGPPPETPARPARKRRAVHADQIDFGF